MIHSFRTQCEIAVLLVCIVFFGIFKANAQVEQGTHPETASENRANGPDAPLKASPSGSPSADLPKLGLPTRWWDDKKVVKHLGLRPEQKKKMDDIFNANKSGISTLYQSLVQEQTRLEQISRQSQSEETTIFAQIDRVAEARASLEKAEAHLLLLLRQELEPSQLKRQKDSQ